MWIVHQKIKRLATTLNTWWKVQFGDIYAKVKEFEEKTRKAEEKLISFNSENDRSNLHASNAEYIRYVKLENSILKQKTQLHGFKKGDTNSSNFHALIRGRKRRIYVHRIQDEDVTRFRVILILLGYLTIISSTPLLVIIVIFRNRPFNAFLVWLMRIRMLLFKVCLLWRRSKGCFFFMYPNYPTGPDGMNGKFFQVSWGIIEHDLFNVI